MILRLPVPRGAALAGALCAALGACSSLREAKALPPEAADAAVPTAMAAAPDVVKDDLALGKSHFRAGHFGLAEMHFRRAVETSPRDPEAWLGLAASYDQLKRYDLADRAYRQALAITGPSAAFLNNRGYSHLLRGDIRRASQDLSSAAAQDPDNEFIQNNLTLLEARARHKR